MQHALCGACVLLHLFARTAARTRCCTPLPLTLALLLHTPPTARRLLKCSPAEAARVISPPLESLAVPAFSEDLAPEMKEAMFQEFNTCSVVLQVRGGQGCEYGGRGSTRAAWCCGCGVFGGGRGAWGQRGMGRGRARARTRAHACKRACTRSRTRPHRCCRRPLPPRSSTPRPPTTACTWTGRASQQVRVGACMAWPALAAAAHAPHPPLTLPPARTTKPQHAHAARARARCRPRAPTAGGRNHQPAG